MILLCDVGGTHLRFAQSVAGRTAGSFRKDKVSAFPALEDAIKWYLRQEKLDAAHVTGFYLAFSNRNNWVVDPASLAAILPRAQFHQVNDFEANAYGVTQLGVADVQVLRPAGDVAPSPGSSACLLGPGTGLGLAYIVYDSAGRPLVQRTHGGHLIPPDFSDELRSMMQATQAIKGNDTMPIYENIATGPGLHRVYTVLCNRSGNAVQHADSHAIISNAADPLCAEALRLFHEMLGGFAGQAASFGHSYKGVYMTGGIIDRIIEHGVFNAPAFFRYFTNNPVPVVAHDLDATPVYWVKDEFISLKGLAALSGQVAS